jgi:hypothetical protein
MGSKTDLVKARIFEKNTKNSIRGKWGESRIYWKKMLYFRKGIVQWKLRVRRGPRICLHDWEIGIRKMVATAKLLPARGKQAFPSATDLLRWRMKMQKCCQGLLGGFRYVNFRFIQMEGFPSSSHTERGLPSLY